MPEDEDQAANPFEPLQSCLDFEIGPPFPGSFSYTGRQMFSPFFPAKNTAMRAADQILQETYLEVRAKLLEVSATLDRIDRSIAQGNELSPASQAKRNQINQAIEICISDGHDRAKRLQQLFSREYQADWRMQMKV